MNDRSFGVPGRPVCGTAAAHWAGLAGCTADASVAAPASASMPLMSLILLAWPLLLAVAKLARGALAAAARDSLAVCANILIWYCCCN